MSTTATFFMVCHTLYFYILNMYTYVTPPFTMCVFACGLLAGTDCARMVSTNDEGLQYNSGEWHQVTVRRQGIDGTLEVTGISSGIN